MQRDVVLRWIEQIVATVRRMLLGPDAVNPAMVMPIIDEAIDRLLGPLALLVPRLDVPSASALLRRVRGFERAASACHPGDPSAGDHSELVDAGARATYDRWRHEGGS